LWSKQSFGAVPALGWVKTVRITVCQLDNDAKAFEPQWIALCAHVADAGSDLVLLPEMPFSPWLADTRKVDPARWRDAVRQHDRWLTRLVDCAPAAVAGTRPVLRDGIPLNEAFVWTRTDGYTGVHAKVYLPDEPGYWEASWYRPGPRSFEPVRIGDATAAFLICTEMWFMRHARSYAKQGVQLLLVPRATPLYSNDKWLAGGRAAAVVAGAYCLSSNRQGVPPSGLAFGGGGWIIEPQEGEVQGVTKSEAPFLTLDLDLGESDRAKDTYPRYVQE
jgi:N-carbamoylputrescine amidase